jgi:excisionase family DNA binding protein
MIKLTIDRLILIDYTFTSLQRDQTMTDEEYFTTTELAKLLKITQRTVYRLMERGDLPYYEIGRAKRFRKSDIEAYLERQKRGG